MMYRNMADSETPADSGTLTNFVEIGQARDKILSLKLDQVCMLVTVSPLVWA
jgi:pre-mRNA-processing factor 6